MLEKVRVGAGHDQSSSLDRFRRRLTSVRVYGAIVYKTATSALLLFGLQCR